MRQVIHPGLQSLRLSQTHKLSQTHIRAHVCIPALQPFPVRLTAASSALSMLARALQNGSAQRSTAQHSCQRGQPHCLVCLQLPRLCRISEGSTQLRLMSLIRLQKALWAGAPALSQCVWRHPAIYYATQLILPCKQRVSRFEVSGLLSKSEPTSFSLTMVPELHSTELQHLADHAGTVSQ
jgi:hypothetical protein